MSDLSVLFLVYVIISLCDTVSEGMFFQSMGRESLTLELLGTPLPHSKMARDC